MARIDQYLKELVEDNKDTIPVPSSRIDYYLNYLIKGGKLEDLPQPESRMDTYLYALCKKGIGSSGSSSKASNISEMVHGHLDGILYEIVKPLQSIEIKQIILKKG